MSKLTDLLERLCPDGVACKPLGEMVQIRNGRDWKSQAPGDIPVYGSGGRMQQRVAVASSEGPSVLLPRKGSLEVQYVDEPIWNVDTVFTTVCDAEVLNTRYFYFVMKSIDLGRISTSATRPSVTQSALRKLSIPVPPLEVQQEIVRVLDAFTDLEQNLAAELELRQKQFEEYRLQAFGKLDADYVGLQSIATIGTGSRNTNEAVDKGAYPFYTRGEEVLFSDEYDFDETSIITAGDGVGVGKTMHFASGKFALHQRAYRINITNSCVEPRFVFHLMKATFLNYMIRNSVHASVTSVRKRMLDDFPVPVLAPEVQQDIVSKLDAFESLIQSLEQEIALRRKQYEFYRDELLTFTPKEA